MKSVLKALLWVIEGIYSLFLKLPQKLRWPAFAILAFASGFSFIHSTSYAADVNHSNTFWTIVGIVLAGFVLDIAVHGFSETKAIGEEDKAKIQSLN